MTGTEKDLENLASAVRNSKQPTTMTFNEIEKEFDEELPKMISDLVWCVSDGGYKIESHRFLSYQDEPEQEYENIKSFLKQSFIKYLQSEVKDAENKIRFIGGETYCVFCKLHRAAGECNCDGWNEAKIDQITHITNQIKELEV